MNLDYTPEIVKTELLSGITTAFALMPECVAFAIVAHLDPLTGIYTAAIICLITALLGGRPGMISGAAGSVAIVSVALVVTHGVEYLYLAAILMGLIQIIIGALKLSKFIRLVPESVVFGFLNGLAIIIFLSQLNQFKTVDGLWISGMPLAVMAVLVAVSMAIMHLLPKLTKKVPGGLVSIIAVTAIAVMFGLDTKTIADIASIQSGLPPFHIPMVPVTAESLMVVLPYALVMASVGLIETLLTLNVVDVMTESRGRPNRETVAQGIANIGCGFFQGMGGCAMIGQTMVNLESGGRRRLSGICAGAVLILLILYGGFLIDIIPMAALVGIMFVVAVNTFKWSSLKMLRHAPKIDSIVMIVVTAITVVFENLAAAVLVGVIISALNVAWQSSKRIGVVASYDRKNNVQYYEIRGPLFFASTASFKEAFDFDLDADTVVINFLESRITDQSAILAVGEIVDRYSAAGVKVYLSHLSQDCLDLLKENREFVCADVLKEPYYKVPSDELD